jgi:hypothetical protein
MSYQRVYRSHLAAVQRFTDGVGAWVILFRWVACNAERSAVNVSNRRIVQVSGFVSSAAAEAAAVAVARKVGGVESITDDMRLK